MQGSVATGFDGANRRERELDSSGRDIRMSAREWRSAGSFGDGFGERVRDSSRLDTAGERRNWSLLYYPLLHGRGDFRSASRYQKRLEIQE